MTSFWSRLFPQRSLRLIESPAWARIDAAIASPNSHASPFSEMSCATGQWWLLTEITSSGGSRSRPTTRYRTIASGWLTENVVLASDEGPTILVPLSNAEIANAIDAQDATPLDRIPKEIHTTVAALPEGHGRLCFREVLLRHGERVELRAVLERLAKPGGYRKTGTPENAELRACPEHGRVHIRDHTLG